MSTAETSPDKGLVELKTIGVEKAVEMRENAIFAATTRKISGYFVVVSRTGMVETSQAIGSKATPANVEIAMAKIKTVLAMRRSSRLQKERMLEKGQSREDFAGQLGSLFGGGVALFEDEARTVFVGAAAFSGGSEEEDEQICDHAAVTSGLFTDVSSIIEMEEKRGVPPEDWGLHTEG